jgi:hypothetical protein
MRDERLNRMWREGKVGFLRPQEDKKSSSRSRGRGSSRRKSNGGSDQDDDNDKSSSSDDEGEQDESLNDAQDDDDDDNGFFNLFTLHQNRDLGRGTKNCVQEAMIPEWMDLCVWGHEVNKYMKESKI